MSILLEQKQALIAGDGQLPVKMAEGASKNGLDVICISLSKDNYQELKKVCSKVYSVAPGELLKIKKILEDEQVKQLTFLGKVHKGLILRRPKFDSMALDLMKSVKRLNDDQVMLLLVEELNKLGLEFSRYKDRWDKLAKSIQTVNKDVENVHITTEKISKKFEMINQVEVGQLGDENKIEKDTSSIQ